MTVKLRLLAIIRNFGIEFALNKCERHFSDLSIFKGGISHEKS